MNKMAFIDRDGTIVEEPDDFQVDRLDKIRFVEDVIPSLLKLKSMNFKLVMVSNQDGLGTTSFPQQDFEICQNFIIDTLKSQGIIFDDILICPHFDHDQCSCRKPNLGLLQNYLHKFNPQLSFVVGDRPSDSQMATNLGIRSYRVDQVSWTEIIDSLIAQRPQSEILRKTNETSIKMALKYQPGGERNIETGLPFFDHMLDQITRYSDLAIDMTVEGDWNIDDHHSVEDVAIVLGQGLNELLGDKSGLNRYGFVLPMDESLCFSAIDLSGRASFDFKGQFARESVNGLSTEMVPHFFKTLSENLKAAIHMEVRGENAHHQVEACFKPVGKSLGQAFQKNGDTIPSTKGLL